MNLTDKAKKLIELDAKRTQGEWNHGHFISPRGARQYFQVGVEGQGSQQIGIVSNVEDSRFVANAANHAAEIAKAYLELVEELEDYKTGAAAEAKAGDEARKEIERLKWEHERDCAGQVQVVDEMNQKLATANALLEKAFKLIRKFDPEDCFIFDDGSEDLAQEVVDFIKEIKQYKESK